MARTAYGMDMDLAAKKASKNMDLERSVVAWIESVCGEQKGGEEAFADWLKNGQVLCNLANALRPGIVRKVNTSKMPFKQMENITFFMNAARELGVPESAMFGTPDLYEKRNVTSVVNCIYTLGGVVQVTCPTFTGPTLGVAITAESKDRKRESRGLITDQSSGFASSMEVFRRKDRSDSCIRHVQGPSPSPGPARDRTSIAATKRGPSMSAAVAAAATPLKVTRPLPHSPRKLPAVRLPPAIPSAAVPVVPAAADKQGCHPCEAVAAPAHEPCAVAGQTPTSAEPALVPSAVAQQASAETPCVQCIAAEQPCVQCIVAEQRLVELPRAPCSSVAEQTPTQLPCAPGSVAQEAPAELPCAPFTVGGQVPAEQSIAPRNMVPSAAQPSPAPSSDADEASTESLCDPDTAAALSTAQQPCIPCNPGAQDTALPCPALSPQAEWAPTAAPSLCPSAGQPLFDVDAERLTDTPVLPQVVLDDPSLGSSMVEGLGEATIPVGAAVPTPLVLTLAFQAERGGPEECPLSAPDKGRGPLASEETCPQASAHPAIVAVANALEGVLAAPNVEVAEDNGGRTPETMVEGLQEASTRRSDEGHAPAMQEVTMTIAPCEEELGIGVLLPGPREIGESVQVRGAAPQTWEMSLDSTTTVESPDTAGPIAIGTALVMMPAKSEASVVAQQPLSVPAPTPAEVLVPHPTPVVTHRDAATVLTAAGSEPAEPVPTVTTVSRTCTTVPATAPAHRPSARSSGPGRERQGPRTAVSLEAEVTTWVEQLTGAQRAGQSIAEWLKNGQVLCALVNALRPGIVRKVNASRMPFKQMENITFFMNAARALGVPETAMFGTPDLYEEKNIPSVVNCLYMLGGAAQVSCPEFAGPHLGVAMTVESKAKKRQTARFVDLSAGFSTTMEVQRPLERDGSAVRLSFRR